MCNGVSAPSDLLISSIQTPRFNSASHKDCAINSASCGFSQSAQS